MSPTAVRPLPSSPPLSGSDRHISRPFSTLNARPHDLQCSVTTPRSRRLSELPGTQVSKASCRVAGPGSGVWGLHVTQQPPCERLQVLYPELSRSIDSRVISFKMGISWAERIPSDATNNCIYHLQKIKSCCIMKSDILGLGI